MDFYVNFHYCQFKVKSKATDVDCIVFLNLQREIADIIASVSKDGR